MVYIDRELKPVVPSAHEVLELAARAPSLAQYLASVGWMNPVYGQLRSGSRPIAVVGATCPG